MLASITPLGERGRQSTWAVTVGAFLIGSAVTGATAGALAGLAGKLLLGSVDERARLITLAVTLLIAVLLDLRREGIPGPRRQVNERWLDEFRGWVYGVGFGAQLGLGVTTVITSAATYVAILAAFLTAGPGPGAVILGSFGLVRGAEPLLAARVRRPDQLISLHSSLDRLRLPALRTVPAVLAMMVIAAGVGAAA